MAGFSATTEWEFDAATGASTNGGSFNTASAGTNYAWGASQQVYALTAITNSVGDWTNISATINPGARGFISADVGNMIYISGGTNFTVGRYQITNVAAGVATLNVACGSGADSTDGTGNMGGSLDNFTTAIIGLPVAGNTIWFKTGTYTLAAAVTAGTAGTAVLPINIFGYNAAHGDNPTIASGNQPVISTATYLWTMANYWKISYVSLSFASTGTSYGVATGLYSSYFTCKVTHTAAGRGFSTGQGTLILNCEFNGGGLCGIFIYAANVGSNVVNCYIHDALVNGVYFAGGSCSVIGCVFDSCVTAIAGGSSSQIILNNTIVNCPTGISGGTMAGWNIINNIIAYCGVGVTWTTSTLVNRWYNNNFYGNDTDITNVPESGYDAMVGNTAYNPVFPTTIDSAEDGATNGAPGTTLTSAGSDFTGVTTDDKLVVKTASGGATAGVYRISAVAPGGDTTKLTLATSPGASKTTIHFGIVRGGASSTNLSLGASSCKGAGYGISLGVG